MRYTSKLIIALCICVATSLCAFADVRVPIDSLPYAKATQPTAAQHMTTIPASTAATPSSGTIDVLSLSPDLASGYPLGMHGPQLLAASTCLSSPPPWYCPAAAPGVAATTETIDWTLQTRLAAYNPHEDEVDEGAHDEDT